jgi:hypothetical protein
MSDHGHISRLREHPAINPASGPGKTPPRLGPWALGAEHAVAAEHCGAHGSGTSPDARAITHALLYVGAVIEGATERLAEDIDAVVAMLDDRLTSIEATIDVPGAPVPLWRRMLARLRRSDQSSGAWESGPDAYQVKH